MCIDENVSPNSKCQFCGTRCSLCNHFDKENKCFSKNPCEETCGFREVVFRGENVQKQFGQWLFSEQNKNYTVMAHNMKGYDGYFLLEYLIANSIVPQVIYSGSKLMYIQVANELNIRIIDSYNFLPTKLSQLPKAFDLQELKKGYFPHFFNTPHNQTYVGNYPDVQEYGCDTMSDKDRNTFLTWHRSKTDDTFDFAKEIVEYCRSDVDILRQACLKFRDILMNITGTLDFDLNEDGNIETYLKGVVDPFNHITIASVCMSVYKTKFLQEELKVKISRQGEMQGWFPGKRVGGDLYVHIPDKGWVKDQDMQENDYFVEDTEFISSPLAQVPSVGYHRDQFSKISISWLEWLMQKERREGVQLLYIRHALNEGEFRLPNSKYKLDGYCAETNTAYEFNGCLWHGCPTCYTKAEKRRMIVPRTQQTLDELYALTRKKERYIKSLGMRLVTIWEHEFEQLLKDNPDVSEFVNSLDIQERLNPRDAFFGGRTNAVKLYKKVCNDEKINYLDFCSLYPSVNKYCVYPLGHPKIVINNFTNIQDYFGVAKVKILPPRNLYHPVLPQRINGKLLFTLCRTCAEQERQSKCTCDDENRCLTGTWCTPEIIRAIEKGYQIVKIYEIYHFDNVSSPNDPQNDLFGGYIDLFLKLKQEASGWPEWVQTEDDALQYIQNYAEKENIKLDCGSICKNPALRSIAKLLLNSFWGKFGQRLNMSQTSFYHETEANKFFRCLFDPSKEVTVFHIINEYMINLTWTNKSDFVKEDFQTNIFIAAFTTCWARLKLYDVLDLLDTRVLYFDTDSVIFVSRPGDVEPHVGPYLGQLTNELDSGDFITEFVSGGPKNYAFRTFKEQEVCRIRGFSLNYTNAQTLNFSSMLDIVTGDQSKTLTVTNPHKITRAKRPVKIYNSVENKRYQLVYSKRVIQTDSYDTLPFGY
jgi:G:T-mismatch repair DNA endonuclease (very short patch repair protein)